MAVKIVKYKLVKIEADIGKQTIKESSISLDNNDLDIIQDCLNDYKDAEEQTQEKELGDLIERIR